jgi:hypothetical protein
MYNNNGINLLLLLLPADISGGKHTFGRIWRRRIKKEGTLREPLQEILLQWFFSFCDDK